MILSSFIEIYLETFKDTLSVCVIVFSTMFFLDYLNIASRGSFERFFRGNFIKPYAAASFLGATSGCVGAFLVVSGWIRGLIGIGPVIAAMIATFGDETYVMFALMPGKTLLFMAALFVLGTAGGMIADRLFRWLNISPVADCSRGCHPLVHAEDRGWRMSWIQIRANLVHPSFSRFLLYLILLIFIFGFLTGRFEGSLWNPEKITMALILAANLFFITTTTEHYLEEHVWKHLIRQHLGKIFIWTFGTLLLVNYGLHTGGLHSFIGQRQNAVWLLLLAALVGLIPESGPNLIFVTMFANGLIPVSVMLTNSMVQDGHGLLPVLSVSWRDAVRIKSFSFCYGLIIGAILLLLGW